jgi:hypothetical protein
MRGVPAGRMLWIVSDPVLHIAIDVSFAGERIEGHISDGRREPKPFFGWLGLIGALDGMLGSPHQDAGHMDTGETKAGDP